MMIDEFWQFARARQHLMVTGMTEDYILQSFRFTNCYRVCDRVSQYLVWYVQRTPHPADLLFRTLLFKTFNKIETWEMLGRGMLAITWHPGVLDKVGRILEEHGGRHIYAAAFRQPIGRTSWGHRDKWRNHLCMIQYIMEGQDALWGCRSLEQLYRTLLQVPMLGPFLAMQFATDLSYALDFPGTFVQPGPGALRGAAKVLGTEDWKNEDAARGLINGLGIAQGGMFEHLRKGGQYLPLSHMDIQNMLCEFDKYCRIKHPHLNSIGRWKKGSATRPKQRYVPSERGRMVWPEDYYIPEKLWV